MSTSSDRPALSEHDLELIRLKRSLSKLGKENRRLKRRIDELLDENSKLAHRCAGDYARGLVEGRRLEANQRDLRVKKVSPR